MTIRLKTMLLALSVAVALGFEPSNSAAQSTGRAALAAKQQIKEQVLSAMADGKIRQSERRDILLKAKNVVTAEEYFSLAQTMNRLSPTDQPTPENLGYAPFVDKKLMAQFPTPDLSWVEKLQVPNIIAKQSFAKEIIPKQPYVVKKTIVKQTIAKASIPNKPKAKESSTKQPVAKTTKPNASSRVVILPPPPQQTDDKQPKPTSVGKVQNTSTKSYKSMPPLSTALPSQTRNTDADKPFRQKVVENSKNHSVTESQTTIQQPSQLLNKAEKTPIRHSYNDYSVPVLTTPTAALLSGSNNDIIKASFDEPLEPEVRQGIIR